MLELTIRMIASLAIVVGLLLLIARVSSRRFATGKGSVVQVMHRQALSRTSSVSVVSVGSRVLVLGATDQQVSVLTELDADELVDANPAVPATSGRVASGAGKRRADRRSARHRATEKQSGRRVAEKSRRGAQPALKSPDAPENISVVPAATVPETSDSAIPLGPVRTEPLPDDLSPAEIAMLLEETVTPAPAIPFNAAHLADHHTAKPAAHRAGSHAAQRAEDRPLHHPDPFLDGLTAAEIAMILGGTADPVPQLSSTAAPMPPAAGPHGQRPHPVVTPEGTGARRFDERTPSGQGRPTPPAPEGPLSGSVLSPATWRQAVAAFTRRAS